MKLTRDKIQRMIERSGKTASGTGGSGGAGIIGNGVTPEYYNQNFELLYKQTVTSGGTTTTTYLTALPNEVVAVGTVTDETTGDVTVTSLIGPIAKNALVIGNLMLVYDSQNNAIKVVSRDGVSSGNFYATGSVSALGYAAGGGGGGATALTELVDVAISSPTNGQVLMYNSTTGKWYNGTVQGGGGSVTSVAAGTGLTTDQTGGAAITGSGTISINSTYQTYISNGNTAYGWGNHANAGYATQNWVGQQGYLTSSAISDMATKTWVSQQGYLTSSAISDMATKTWVSQQGYLTSSAISDMATKTWVGQQGFLKVGSDSVLEIGQYLDFHVASSSSDYSTRIYASSDAGNTVTLPTSAGTLALTSDNVASATKLQNARTIWGQSFDGTANISGDMTDVWTINGKMQIGNGVTGIRIGPGSNRCNVSINGVTNSQTLHLNYGTNHSATDGGGIFFHYGNGVAPGTDNLRQATSLALGESSRPSDDPDTPILAIYSPISDKVKVMIGQDNTSANGCSLQIGMVRLVYDSTNNALKVEKVDGTSASFYATGSVSALGFSAGTSAVDAMTFGYLTVNNRLYFENTSNYIYHDSDGINLKAGAGEQIYCQSKIYAQNGIESDGDLIMGSDIRMYGFKIYLTSSAYIYVSGNTLYFSNGTTTRTIATL